MGLLIEDCMAARAWPAGSLRVLETGSTGGILTALLLETEMSLQIKSVDFVDPFPPTLEIAVERAIGWSKRRYQFLNANLETLPPEPRYDLVLACSAFQNPAQTADLAETLALRQPTQGVLLHLHETLDPAHLTYHLFQYDRLGRRGYAAGNGTTRRFSAAWVRRWTELKAAPPKAAKPVVTARVW